MDMILDNLIILVPLLVLHFSLMVFCIVKIFKDGVGIFNRWVWLVIVVFVNFIGSILFLTIGRKKESYDTSEES